MPFLSDFSEGNDGQKRRRLGAAGQENRSPKPLSSGRLAELETKPDTPMVPSVLSRVQQLTQRREGNPTFTVEAAMLIFRIAKFTSILFNLKNDLKMASTPPYNWFKKNLGGGFTAGLLL